MPSRPREAQVLVRAFPVGAAPRRDPRRPHHLQRRRARAQAGHQHDQLHRVGHHRGLDGRHPRQGPRGRPDAQGRLRHRLRVLHAAPARRLRRRRRRLHLGPDVLHGYLRQDVLHRQQRRRPPRRADGHLRRQPPGREGLHPRQARGRPPAPVQPVAADHRRLHGRRSSTTPTGRWCSRSTSQGADELDLADAEAGGLARLADHRRATSPATTAWSPARSTATSAPSTCGT
jgi:hypothetical protein